MAKKQIIGAPRAFGYYSPQMHIEHPASTYAFSKLRYSPITGHYSVSRIVNIFWHIPGLESLAAKLSGMDDAQKEEAAAIANFALSMGEPEELSETVRRTFPDAVYRGIITSKNYFVSQSVGGLRVAGPDAPVNDFSDGLIIRPHPPSSAEKKLSTLGLHVIASSSPKIA